MKKQHPILRAYFSDYVRWLFILALLLAVSIIFIVASCKVTPFAFIIPLLFLLLYLMSTPLLVLYCRASKDIKNGSIEKCTIQISEIQNDNRFNFRKNGGIPVGMDKYRIIDEHGHFYLLSATTRKRMFIFFHPQPNFSLKIEVLKKSRLVLSMRIIESSTTIKEAREQHHNIKHLKDVFNHYFINQ